MSNQSKSRMEEWPLPPVRFLREQIGRTEDELKAAIVRRWTERECGPLRAYLVEVEYRWKKRGVALCLALDKEPDAQLAEDAAAAFRGMFRSDEHLVIFFVKQRQERRLRETCCPFFSSQRLPAPDFWMLTSDGAMLEEPRACYKTRRLAGGHSDGYLLCEIVPPFIGQRYGLGARDIDQVVITGRDSGSSLFAIKKWPAHVHVWRLTVDVSDDVFAFAGDEFESMIWAELYDSRFATLPGSAYSSRVVKM